MNIKETFLALTSKTYPYGFEKELSSFLPKGYYNDEQGNYYYKIGNSRTAFTSHLDTACKSQVKVVHKIDGMMIRTDGKSILGADDKAGVTILLYMIEKNVSGLYCFFVGEEVGCIGSGFASRDKSFKEYDRMISFDRRGTESIITHQSSSRCCSDKFANELSKEYSKFGMNLKLDDTGVYTDSAEFTSVIPECTNISVGYYQEHTHNESQDILHLIKIANSSTKVNWESLPTERDTKVTDYKNNNWGTTYNRYDSECHGYAYGYNKRKKRGYRYSTNEWSDEDVIRNNRPSKGLVKGHSRHEFKESGKLGRVFWNDIDNEITDSFHIEDISTEQKNYYESLKQYIFDDNLSANDFEKLKDNYLDMDNVNDAEFYEHISKLI